MVFIESPAIFRELPVFPDCQLVYIPCTPSQLFWAASRIFPCCHSMEKRAFQYVSFALWWNRLDLHLHEIAFVLASVSLLVLPIGQLVPGATIPFS